jgi:hypothetical protein
MNREAGVLRARMCFPIPGGSMLAGRATSEYRSHRRAEARSIAGYLVVIVRVCRWESPEQAFPPACRQSDAEPAVAVLSGDGEGSLLCRAGAHRFLPAWLPDGGHNGAMLTRLRDQLVAEGEEALRAEPGLVRFTGNHEADELLNDLANHPHAFVFAAFVDRQVKVERAWMVPLLLRQRLGSFEIRDLESLPEGQWLSLMREPAPAHRMPETMARVLHRATGRILTHYAGDASRIWAGKAIAAPGHWPPPRLV